MALKVVEITENFSDIDKVNALAIEAFPQEEYLPPSELIEMSKAEGFDFLALYYDDKFVGFMAVMTHEMIVYLFFLAIDNNLRGAGYGSLAIKTLKDLYPDYQQVVDFEMVDESAANNEQRKTRRKFYLKNGYKPTGKFLSYLGVDYEIFCMDEKFDLCAFKKLMSRLKIDGFDPHYFEKQGVCYE